MRFYTVCTLPHYFPEDVYRLHEQLRIYYDGDVDMFVYTDRPSSFNNTVNVIEIDHDLCKRQWYKIDFFKPGFIDTTDPVIVTDLDWLLLDDVTEIIDMPVQTKQFAAVERWWRSPSCGLTINGGLYKFYPNTMERAYNTFYSNPQFWQTVYFGPNKIEGEQNFVSDVVSLTHDIIHFPGKKIGRHIDDPDALYTYNLHYQENYGAPMIANGAFNPQLALVHGRLSFS